MTTASYRLSSGEVIAISQLDQPFEQDMDLDYWGMLTDPTLTDGIDLIDLNGDRRVLGYAKIAIPGNNEIRNATQAEIDNFDTLETDDENIQDADSAIDLLQTHPRFRKLLVAFADILVDEFNIVRAWNSVLKGIIENSNNLADIKTGVAALSDLPDRSLSQLRTAIINRISKDD